MGRWAARRDEEDEEEEEVPAAFEVRASTRSAAADFAGLAREADEGRVFEEVWRSTEWIRGNWGCCWESAGCWLRGRWIAERVDLGRERSAWAMTLTEFRVITTLQMVYCNLSSCQLFMFGRVFHGNSQEKMSSYTITHDFWLVFFSDRTNIILTFRDNGRCWTCRIAESELFFVPHCHFFED